MVNQGVFYLILLQDYVFMWNSTMYNNIRKLKEIIKLHLEHINIIIQKHIALVAINSRTKWVKYII